MSTKKLPAKEVNPRKEVEKLVKKMDQCIARGYLRCKETHALDDLKSYSDVVDQFSAEVKQARHDMEALFASAPASSAHEAPSSKAKLAG